MKEINMTNVLTILALATVILSAVLFLLGWKGYKAVSKSMKKKEREIALIKLMPAGYGFMRLRRQRSSADSKLFRLYLKRYNSIPRSKERYNAFLADTCGLSILLFDLLTFFLALYSRKTSESGKIAGTAFLGSVLIGVCIYLARKKEFDNDKRRREEIADELPVVMNKIVILLGSGMPMSKVLEQLGNDPGNGNPLYEELKICRLNIQNGTRSPQDALADMQRRCPGQSMSRFASALIRNITKGTDDCDYSLMQLAHEMWHEKKANSSRRYKRLKNKLFIPTVVMFGMLLIVVSAPAFMQLKNF